VERALDVEIAGRGGADLRGASAALEHALCPLHRHALKEFRAQWRTMSPGAVAVGDRAWREFVPFWRFRPKFARSSTPRTRSNRTTKLRKVTEARGSFPSDAAALKLLYPAIRDINPKGAVSHA
jgi:transposase-like protein